MPENKGEKNRDNGEENLSQEASVTDEIDGSQEASEIGDIPEIYEKSGPEKNISCDQCEFRTDTASKLKYHTEAKHTIPTVRCPQVFGVNICEKYQEILKF